MKFNTMIQITVLVTTLSTAAFAADAKSVLHIYNCNNSKLSISVSGKKYTARLSYKTENHVTNIASAAQTLKILQMSFAGGDESVDDDTQAESGLPDGSLAFSGFHYPSGEMYVTAEGDTNEEGYILAIEKGVLDGAPVVQAASIFWNERSDSDISNYSCTLVQ